MRERDEGLARARNHRYRNVARVSGKIVKTGELRVDPIDGLPFLLREGMEVFLTPPPLRGIRSSRVEGVRELGGGWAVRFSDVRDAQTAFDLVGRTCLVAEDDLGEGELEAVEGAQWALGLMAVDEELGRLGEVVDIAGGPMQAMLVVARCGEGEGSREILIPLVDEYVRGFDEEEGVVYVRVPEQLVDLNA